MECDAADRNPSPPPELLEHGQELLPDRVGESVFSKHWLFQILLNIIEAVNLETTVDTGDESEKPEGTISDIHELDSKLEEDACALWDMSANADVAQFLHEFKILEIFLEVIEKTKSPRLLEIVIGVLGNLAAIDDLCQDMSRNEALLKSIVGLIGSSDAPTIIQALRLIHTGIVNRNSGNTWLEVLRADSSFMTNIRFIFDNSLNGEVLKGALQLLYYIFDKDDTVCNEWANKDSTKSVVSAGKQLLALSEFEAIDELWLLLNLLCQHDDNVTVLVEHFDELRPVYRDYLIKSGEDSYSFLPPMERVAAIAAHFTTLATLLQRENRQSNDFLADDEYIKYVRILYGTVTTVLEKGTVIKQSDRAGDGTKTEETMEQQERDVTANSTNSSTHCNGEGGEFSNRGKLTHSISIQQEDYDSLFILKETMTELCSIICPSVLSTKDSES